MTTTRNDDERDLDYIARDYRDDHPEYTRVPRERAPTQQELKKQMLEREGRHEAAMQEAERTGFLNPTLAVLESADSGYIDGIRQARAAIATANLAVPPEGNIVQQVTEDDLDPERPF